MPNLKDFAGRMNTVADNVRQNSNRVVRKTALAVDAAVVIATPVDTGRARSNWQVELNAAAEGVLDPYVPGEKGGSGSANAQAAIEHGKGVIASHKDGDQIHITNNLAYIQALNEGHSAQAPANFVEKAVQVGVNAIRASGSITAPPPSADSNQ